MAIILDGKKVAGSIRSRLGEAVAGLNGKLCLAIIQIGSDARSEIYIKRKKSFGESIGAEVRHIHLDDQVTQDQVVAIIEGLNKDTAVHGIIVQLPIPAHLDKEVLVRMVDPQKDVDGLASDTPLHTPATARGVMSLLNAYGIEVKGKKAVVIGKSRLVGGPIARCLAGAGAAVVTCDKSTIDIPSQTQQADIVVVAAGTPQLVTIDYVKKDQVIIDVGINPVTGEGDSVSHTVGDVDFPVVSHVVGAISPVPGGVGPLTVASLFENLFDAFQLCTHTR
jgi:methylenetetrahydrofolate dehydrogenase (NADP+)/methenyltetrahydrofolate cyclohydrolase